MEILTRLGLFLFLFAFIVFGSKLLLSRKTRRELQDISRHDPAPPFFQAQNRMLFRIIIVLVLAMLVLYVLFMLR